MKLEEFEEAVAVQQKAYALLLWLKERAHTNPALLSSEQVEPFASGDSCVDWVRRHSGAFPQQLRPGTDQVRAFGYVLSSFFRTSFRIEKVRDWDNVETRLVPGINAPSGRRHKLHLAQRQKDVADELSRLTLIALAEENGISIPAESLEQAFSKPEVFRDLTLFAYGCELVRRCHYASQGAGVHRLWLELDEKVRKNLSGETIWKARARLLHWLRQQN